MATVEIVIPAYNEGKRLGPVLGNYLRHFDASVHFTVVANYCTDNTVELVETIQQQFPNRITLINEPSAIGKGGAILLGWKQAQADYLGFVDADGATVPEEYEKLLQAVQQHDGAIASRFIEGSTVLDRSSMLRRFVSWAARRCFQILFLLPYHDTQCGAKIFKQSVLKPLLDNIKTVDMLFDVELLWRLKQQHSDLVEVPTVWVDQPGSAMLGSSSRFIAKATQLFFNVLKLRITLR